MREETQKSVDSELRILGRHPRNPDVFLLSAPDLIQIMDLSRPPIKRGRILDMERKMLFAPRPLASILVRMSFNKYTGDQSILPDMLAQVEEEKEVE